MSGLTETQKAEIWRMMKEMLEKTGKKLDESNRILEGMINDSKLWREESKNDNKPETGEVPKDENPEQVLSLIHI